MAEADANYKFIMIDIGSYGKYNDVGILSNLNILKSFENKTLKLSYSKKLPNSNVTGQYTFIADEAFPLRTYMMWPYLLNDENKSYFNYRLSRAWLIIECAFGIAVVKFRILQKSIETKVKNADHVIKALRMLYNVIIDLEKIRVTENYNIHSNISSRINNLSDDLTVSVRNNKTSRVAENVRNNLSIFFPIINCKYFTIDIWLCKITI